MKRLFYSLLVVGATFGASSYALIYRTSRTYYLNGSTDQYELSVPAGKVCAMDASPGCELIFEGINLPTVPFNKDAIPTSSDYTVTPNNINQSHQ